MYEDELCRVRNEINRIHDIKMLVGVPIIFFGVSENTRQMIEMVKELGYKPTVIIDNDLTKSNSFYFQTLVKPVSGLTDEEIERGVFFIYSYFWREMKNQLLQMNVDKERIISFFLKNKSLEEQFEMAEKGVSICEKLSKKYDTSIVFLCPYTGTGDIYLIGTFWNEYLENTNIAEYIFIVVSKACEKVTRIFDIKNVEIISQIESSYLIEYYKLCGKESNIKILNDSWWELRANPLQRFRGFRGLYFMEIFRKFVFNLPDTSRPRHPILKDESMRLHDLFISEGLAPGGTVVLSPYSNTLSDLSMDFWKEIAANLKKKGYCVVTNCGGKDEIEIEGTKKLFFSLDIAPQVIEYAGYFIGVRSGFCDCISAAKAKLIILYDRRNRFFNCSAYEYFNLKNMGLSDDAIEMEYDNDYEELMNNIMTTF